MRRVVRPEVRETEPVSVETVSSPLSEMES